MFKPIRAWRAYYSPDLWYCGRTHEEAVDLPDGILVVVAYEAKDHSPHLPYRRILAGADWYFWSSVYAGSLTDFKRPSSSKRKNRWLSPKPITDQFPDAVLKKGIWVSDEEYQETRELAQKSETAPW